MASMDVSAPARRATKKRKAGQRPAASCMAAAPVSGGPGPAQTPSSPAPDAAARPSVPTETSVPGLPSGPAERSSSEPSLRPRSRHLPASADGGPAIPVSRQLDLFPEAGPLRSKESTSGSFVGNMDLPVHRWFRYSAGFSGAWAEDLISQEAEGRDVQVFDPFAGSGTTLVAAEHCGVESWGIDSHTFVSRVARAKLAYRSSPEEFLERAKNALVAARRVTPALESHAPVIRRCYTDEALEQLDCLRRVIEHDDDDSESARLVWLVLVCILRPTSHVGTANCQYLLPDRRKLESSSLSLHSRR